MAFTSMCEANWENNSEGLPVRILTTPPGTSDELITSAKLTAHRGFVSEARITQVFPPAMIGEIVETNPTREFSCGAIAATTPVDSGTEKLKCEEATGFTVPNICWYLSHQPA